MAKTLTLRYTPTPEDHIKGTQTFILHIARTRVLFLIFGLAFVIGLLLIILSEPLRVAGVVLVLLLPILAFVIFVFSPITLRRRILKDRRMLAERTWILSDDQFTVKNRYAEVKFDWSGFNLVKETEEQYVFIASTFIFLPKRAFESKEQEAEFRKLIKKHIKVVSLKAD